MESYIGTAIVFGLALAVWMYRDEIVAWVNKMKGE